MFGDQELMNVHELKAQTAALENSLKLQELISSNLSVDKKVSKMELREMIASAFKDERDREQLELANYVSVEASTA